MSDPKRLPKQYYFDDGIIDVMLNAMTNITAELSITRERLDTIEHLLETDGSVSRESIDAFTPGPETEKARMQARLALIQAALDPFRTYFAEHAKKAD